MDSENLTQFPTRFVSYPTNRLIAHFSSREQIKRLLSGLEALDVDIGSVYILDAQEGLDALDVSGERHGTLGKLSRMIHQGGSTTEREKFEGVVNNLSKGGVTVAIHAKNKALRDSLIELYRKHGGDDITYAALLYIKNLSNSPELFFPITIKYKSNIFNHRN